MTVADSGARYDGASARAIQHHYDIGNEFYALWLDPTQSYSCALFEDPAETLEQAQLNKLDYIAGEALAPGVRRVLDIGCGWGGLLERLRNEHGVRETIGLTLSPQQQHYVQMRFGDAHAVRLESWHDHEPDEPYDAIVSVGAFEHFARPELTREARIRAYRDFFGRCCSWLKPSGGMCLQTICYDLADRRELSPFFRDWVFPESDLPRMEEIVEAARGLFHVVRMRNDPDHYVETCRRWRKQLRARRAEAAQFVDAEVIDNFLKYLALSALSFQMRKTGLLRITLRRTDRPLGLSA